MLLVYVDRRMGHATVIASINKYWWAAMFLLSRHYSHFSSVNNVTPFLIKPPSAHPNTCPNAPKSFFLLYYLSDSFCKI